MIRKFNLINRSGDSAEVDVTDHEVNDFLEENWSDINNKLNIALKIGVITLRNASTTVDTSFVDKEFNNLQNRFNEKFRQFQEEWDSNVKKVFGDDFIKMKECLDPDKKNTPTYRTVENLDQKIKELKKDMDPHDDNTPIGKFKKDIERQLQEIYRAVCVKAAEKAEAEKGTAKGTAYEEEVGNKLLDIASSYEDSFEPTGSIPGIGGSKKGDGVSILSGSDGGRIVFEIKDKDIVLNTKFYEEEIRGSMENRDASVCVLVVHPAFLPGEKPLKIWRGAIVCKYDNETKDTTALEVAYQLARHIAKEKLSKPEDAFTSEDLKDDLESIIAKVDKLTQIEKNISKAISSLEENRDKLNEIKNEIKEELRSLLSNLESKGHKF